MRFPETTKEASASRTDLTLDYQPSLQRRTEPHPANARGLFNQGAPLGVGIGLTCYQVILGGFQFLVDKAATACADLPTIDFTNRRYFGGGAGKEGLVGDIHLI